MANEQNLKPFSSENQPPGHLKSRKGIPNRATVIKKWGKVKTNTVDPTTGEEIAISLMEAAVIGQFMSAAKGNTNAFKEIQDSLHGKMPDKQELDVKGDMKVTHLVIQGVPGTDGPDASS